MTDIVEKLRALATSDHERGCPMRSCSCECGYEGDTEKALNLAAAEIERLRARLEIPEPPFEAYDGIDCRDETIRGLEAKVRGEREAVVKWLRRKADACAGEYMDIINEIASEVEAGEHHGQG